ncbi:kinase-like domain-containing protein [Massariosphaeria phaeospora]|uniref:Kinase-like domain-containing protein n=1 Tax=Massariosphaeria phaeospora TaxID=100035 RepID=A0A7C8I126_9PLEO|nr:kinase-like domain-containing protein [Massariosphaeria phaeospora]
MAAEAPCTACSWTTGRQDAGRYHSNVKLFYNISDRAAWSLGPKYIFKERSNEPPSFEARNLRFLKEKTTIPVPTVVLDYDHNDRNFIQTERIPGDTLDTVWASLSAAEKELIAKQTGDYLSQLRQLQSPRMQSLGEQPLFSTFLFRDDFGEPHGPLSSDDELWAVWAPVLKDLPEKARSRFRERMPSAEPYTFTHGDLSTGNIMVKDGNLTGILDWETSGYFPVWWEFTCAGIGLGEEDSQWKSLLRKHLSQHKEGHEFWLDLYALSAYPDLNERGLGVLAQLLCD